MLRINRLAISFESKNGNIPIIEDVSFEIPKGSILSLVGESGSGKTIISQAIMGLNDPKVCKVKGSILFDDKELVDLNEKEYCKIRGKDISMIFQEPMSALNPLMSIERQLKEAVLIHRPTTSKLQIKDEMIESLSLMKLTDIPRILNSFPHQLSGGQLQRVMIAMALINKPTLLIADEPTTALDVTVQKEIVSLIKELRHRLQLSVLFISHDLGLVSNISDEVCILKKGKILENGPVSRVINKPTNPYTKALIACRPSVDGPRKYFVTINDILENTTKDIENQELNSKISSNEMGDPILEVENISVSYTLKRNFIGRPINQHKALSKIGFGLHRGEILGVVGESGSGKSTLAKVLLRIIHPDEGQVRFDRSDWLSLKGDTLRKSRKNIQMVFQDPFASLNPKLTIGFAIKEPMEVHGIHLPKDRKMETIKLLEMVGLQASDYSKYPSEFSGGQRQRISIARALSVNPQVLVCDESVSALDVSIQSQVLNLLLGIQRKFGLAIVFISHDLSVVYSLCDNVLVLKDGQMVEYGPIDQIFRNPKESYTQNLLDAIPRFVKQIG